MRALPGIRRTASVSSALLDPAQPGTRVKICCISSVSEAELALEEGADALGLVSAMPSGPGVILDDEIRRVIAWVEGRRPTVLLTSRRTASGIAAQLTDAAPAVLQLCDEVSAEEKATTRQRFPGLALMPVVHVRDARSVAQARTYSEHADALLLDSGNPGAAIPELGGTGRTHDWNVSATIVAAAGVPVFLAGGLRADNVAQAIDHVRPHGVDVCSGVRKNGRLDRQLLRDFITQLRTN